ncbi:hypothetical protein QYE76_040682 [Lolium multiflorum]|uniref:RNA-directed DNA polymerase n=1 Tax=Lolium multiflorum TaxID=4521 RepID=A0AAD8WTF2_LOLMU|nr:hypothetical protein QYE76_040682 [Lolium multiflorum]
MPSWERSRPVPPRFGPTLRGSRLAELGRLAFTTTVQDFADRFQALACHAPGVSARQRADLFVGGLPDYIRVDVEMREPADLQTAMYYARAYEQRAIATQQVYAQRGSARPALRPAQTPTAPRAPRRQLRPRALCADSPLQAADGCGAARAAPPGRASTATRCAPGHTCARLFYTETVDDTDVEALTAELAAATITRRCHDLRAGRRVRLCRLSSCYGGHQDGQDDAASGDYQWGASHALVDTGSTHNFLSNTAMRRLALQPAGSEKYSVTVANGDRLTCQGVARQVPVLVGDEPFSIACVGIDLGCYDFILGLDFLSTLGPILWDLDVLTLIFGARAAAVFTGRAWAARRIPAATRWPPRLTRRTRSWPTYFSSMATSSMSRRASSLAALRPPHTPAAPVAVRPYRPQCEGRARASVAVMLAQGIIRISTSPFSAPVLLVRKADGTWRFCIDFRALNTVTSKDKFPIPVVDELLDELHGARFFTKLDLRSGYHQVRMHPDDIAKTAFRTHHGHYEFLVMPFGLSNAPATFQALMNDVLSPYLRRFVLVFFDDILIYSASWAEHLQHVAIIFNELRAHRLHLKRSKCSFGTTSVAYLGHVISADGVAMDADKVAAVAAWPTPQSPRALRGFLGLAGYYRRYIQDFGLIAAPLTRLLRRDAFSWDEEAATAFAALQRALTTGPGEGPLAFFSRPFAARHHKLAAYERELIGLVQAVRHWRAYLWGRTFRVRTDHYSLKFLLDQRLSTVPQHRWISKLFDFTVEYRPGRLNTVADALSRRDIDDAVDAPTVGAALCIHSGPSFAFIDEVRRATAEAADAQQLRQRLADGELAAPWRRTRDYSSMGAASSCRIMETCATRPCPWHILQVTRASRRPAPSPC